MIRRPPRSTRTDTLFPYTTLFRSAHAIIANEILPAFRQGDYPGGIAAGVDAIILAIAGAYEPLERSARGGGEQKGFSLFGLLVSVVVIVFILFSRGRGRRSEERRVGKECLVTFRCRCAPDLLK